LNKKTILIVDDHSPSRLILSFDLQKGGFKTLTADRGKKGIEIANTESPDLILLDAMMPGIDGFETCRRLKANKTTQHIPVIMLTAKREKKDIEEGREAGVRAYVVKPYHLEKLLAQIGQLIGDPNC